MKSSFSIAQLFLLLFLSLLLQRCGTPNEKVANKPKTVTVQIKQMQFQPATVTIEKGDTVVFINNDMVAHDVTEEKKKAWASGPMQPGASWKTVPTEDATYYCSIHAVMKGQIRVNK